MKFVKKSFFKSDAIRKYLFKIRGEITTEELIQRGLKVGKNFNRMGQVIIDDSHAWLIEIGDQVTLAPRVHILAHDASTKLFLGYTKIGRVTIGNNIFIGAGSIILPGVTIGNNVIVGAGSVVTHDIQDNVLVAGNPAKVLCTIEEYLEKEKKRKQGAPCYGEEYTMRGGITKEQKQKQKADLSGNRIGYVD